MGSVHGLTKEAYRPERAEGANFPSCYKGGEGKSFASAIYIVTPTEYLCMYYVVVVVHSVKNVLLL